MHVSTLKWILKASKIVYSGSWAQDFSGIRGVTLDLLQVWTLWPQS